MKFFKFFGYFSGYETSSTTMLFTLYELALNPEIQTKVRQEIRKALQKHGEITYEMMIDIPYLDQVINGKLSNIHVLTKQKSKN